MDLQEIENDGFEVGEVLTSDDDLHVVLTHDRTRFILVMRRPEGQDDDDLVTKWFYKFGEAQADLDDMAYDRCLETLRESAISACKDTIYTLSASIPTPEQDLPNLEDFLHPTTFYLRVFPSDGTLQALRMNNTAEIASLYEPVFLAVDLLPRPIQALVPAVDLEIIQDLHMGQVLKVSKSNEVCVFKRAHYGGREQLIREIQLLQQISENWEPGHPNCPAVPRILGLVTSRDQIAGILEEFIDGEKLSELDMEDVSTEQRQKWKQQVQHTITLLHRKNFVWGDVKPDNVLIDKEARAWLIDFGGSWTDGWVDEHLAETIEGDLQGLDRLMKHLGL